MSERPGIEYTVHIWQEGAQFIAHAMPLDVMSSGQTPEQARHALDEAVRLFLDTAAEVGTLEEVLGRSPGCHHPKQPENGWDLQGGVLSLVGGVKVMVSNTQTLDWLWSTHQIDLVRGACSTWRQDRCHRPWTGAVWKG